MTDNDDDIPVLTDAIERAPTTPRAQGELDRLQAQICAASLRLAEEMLRDACREAEQVLMERMLNTLKSELPAIVRGVLKEHLEK